MRILRDRRGWVRAGTGWGLFVWILTSWPNPPTPPAGWPIPSPDRLIHFLLYGIEAALLMRAIRWSRVVAGKRSVLSHLLVVGGVMGLWGMLDEAHQAFIPGRSVEGADWAADIFGSVAGGLLSGAFGRAGSPEAATRSGVSSAPLG